MILSMIGAAGEIIPEDPRQAQRGKIDDPSRGNGAERRRIAGKEPEKRPPAPFRRKSAERAGAEDREDPLPRRQKTPDPAGEKAKIQS